MRPPLDDGVILITGASSGIGREMARQLAPRARTLVLVARRSDRLEELRAELVAARPALSVHIEVRDLAEPGVAVALADSVRAAVGDVDVLINNAGVGDMGTFDRADPARLEAMIALNVTSVVALTRALVGPMVTRGRGGVLNVSSSFGLAYLPSFAVYIGTKHFITGFTEALRADLAGTGVIVTQVCPGPVATEFEQNIGNWSGQKPPGLIEISPERCARAALAGFERNRALIIPGALMWLTMAITRSTPRVVARAVVGLLGRFVRRRQLATAAPPPALPGGDASS
jgi:uncharacterized protein